MNIRPADPDRDAAAVAAIYRPAIETTLASFEEPAPDAVAMSARMHATLRRYPWLVAVEGDSVVGYAYAGPHAERAGYRWSVNVSAYVDAAFHGRGIGRRLYDELLPILRRRRFVTRSASKHRG